MQQNFELERVYHDVSEPCTAVLLVKIAQTVLPASSMWKAVLLAFLLVSEAVRCHHLRMTSRLAKKLQCEFWAVELPSSILPPTGERQLSTATTSSPL